MAARIASISLTVWAAPLSACSQQESTDTADEVQREAAERQALINAMEHHPALENRSAQATGKPIHVPTTVPPKPAGRDEHHHRAEPQKPPQS